MSRQVKKVNISGKEDKSNKVSSWSNTTTDIHYPSEKLVKDSLDGKANSTHTHSQYLTEHQDLSNYVTTDDSRLNDARTPTSHTHTKSQITDFPTIPSASSTVPSADTTNGSYGSGTSYARSNHIHPKSSIYAEASHTHSQYLTSHQDISSKEDTSNKLTSLQSLNDLSTDTQYPSAKLVYNYWSDLNDTLQNDYPLSNSLGAVAFSNDYTDLDNLPQLGNLAFEDTIDLTGHDINELDDGSGLLFSGDYDDLDNKPTIPTGTSDLINNSGFLTHQDISGKIDSAGTGLSKSGTTLNHSNSITALTTASFKKVKYDSQGHITGTSDVSASDLPTHTHSQYLTSHQDITGKEDSSNKVSSWNSTTNNIRYPTEKLVKDSLDGKSDNGHTHSQYLTSHQDITGKEDKSNKVTSISSSSTDAQYPSAKLVYNQLNEKATKTELDKKLDADSRIVTTFTPQDYQYIMSNGSWTNGYQVSLSASGQLALDLSDMFTLQGDYVEFIVKTGANSVSFGILYGNSNEVVASFPSSSTRRIKVILGNSLEYTISDESNNILNQFSVPYPVITFSSSSATTLNFGEKQWYHYVPFIDRVYPIGSIYMSVNSVNPSLFIGGEWERIQDRFLLASGSTYSAGSTGGSANAIVVSHSHEPSNTDFNFLASQGNIAVNSTKRAFPSTSTDGHHFVYTDDDSNYGINEYTNTSSVGSSGTGKNMPPYLAVYIWKRIG